MALLFHYYTCTPPPPPHTHTLQTHTTTHTDTTTTHYHKHTSHMHTHVCMHTHSYTHTHTHQRFSLPFSSAWQSLTGSHCRCASLPQHLVCHLSSQGTGCCTGGTLAPGCPDEKVKQHHWKWVHPILYSSLLLITFITSVTLAHTHTHTHACMHTHTHTLSLSLTHTHTHTHTHMKKQKHWPSDEHQKLIYT